MHFFHLYQPTPKKLDSAYMGNTHLATSTYAHQALAILKRTAPGALPALVGLSLIGHKVHPVMIRNDHAHITWLAENNMTLSNYKHFESRLPRLILDREAPTQGKVIHLYTPPLLPELLAIAAEKLEAAPFRILLLTPHVEPICPDEYAAWGEPFDLIVAADDKLAAQAESAGGKSVAAVPQIAGELKPETVMPVAIALEMTLRNALRNRGLSDSIEQTGKRSLRHGGQALETLQDCVALLQGGHTREALWLLEILDQIHPGWTELQTIRNLILSAMGYPDVH